MFKKIIFIFVFVFIFTISTYAIDGYIKLEYDIMNKHSNGQLYIYEEFNNLIIGGKFQCNLMGYNLKNGIIPAGIPSSQVYELIIKYDITNNISVNMTEGCEHHFEQSQYTEHDDVEYIKFGTKYEF